MHHITQCVHGTIVSQCRCPAKDKPVRIVDCPPHCLFALTQLEEVPIDPGLEKDFETLDKYNDIQDSVTQLKTMIADLGEFLDLLHQAPLIIRNYLYGTYDGEAGAAIKQSAYAWLVKYQALTHPEK